MKRALIGNGGHAREVMAQMNKRLVRFVDDDFYVEEENVYKLSEFDNNEFEVLVAISDVNVKKNIVSKLPNNTKFFSFIHPTAIVLSSKIGEGSFIGAYSVVTCDITIGSHALLNRSNHIGHDCVIGDFLSMMPGSIISGNCTIGNNFYLGTNASIKEKIKICDDVIVGMGSAVVSDIKESGTYVGVPIRKIK